MCSWRNREKAVARKRDANGSVALQQRFAVRANIHVSTHLPGSWHAELSVQHCHEVLARRMATRPLDVAFMRRMMGLRHASWISRFAYTEDSFSAARTKKVETVPERIPNTSAISR